MIGNYLERYIVANTFQNPKNNNKARIPNTKGVKQFMRTRKYKIRNKKINKPKLVST